MSVSDSDELLQAGRSDSESEHPGTSLVDRQRRLGINVQAIRTSVKKASLS